LRNILNDSNSDSDKIESSVNSLKASSSKVYQALKEANES